MCWQPLFWNLRGVLQSIVQVHPTVWHWNNNSQILPYGTLPKNLNIPTDLPLVLSVEYCVCGISPSATQLEDCSLRRAWNRDSRYSGGNRFLLFLLQVLLPRQVATATSCQRNSCHDLCGCWKQMGFVALVFCYFKSTASLPAKEEKSVVNALPHGLLAEDV